MSVRQGGGGWEGEKRDAGGMEEMLKVEACEHVSVHQAKTDLEKI